MTLWTVVGICAAHAAEVQLQVREHGTGAPLPMAEVVTESGLRMPLDPKGRASLDLAHGARVLIRSPEHLEAHFVWEDTLPSPVYVYLHPIPAPLEIVVESFQTTPHVARHLVDAEIALETPGALEDSVRLIQSLPGVAIQREYSPGQGQLSVRGSQPGDNLVYLDGIEIPYLYHYNQYASVIPTTQLARLELFPSTFGVQYGNATGAVVEASTLADAPTHVEGDASVNFVMTGGRIATPLKGGWWAAASGRRSYFDAAGRTSEQYPVFPRFHDFLIRLDHEGDQRATRFKWWGAGDGYQRALGELDVLDPVERSQTPHFDFNQQFQVLSALHEWRGPEVEGRAVWGLVQHTRDSHLETRGHEFLQERSLAHRLDLHGASQPSWAWDAGYELRGSLTELNVNPADRDGLLVAEEAPSLARGLSVDEQAPRLIGATYGDVHLIGGPVRVIPGVRVGLDSESLSAWVDPRLVTRWRLHSSSALKVAGGRYTQRPDNEDLFRGDLPPLPTTSSLQVAAGLEQTLSGRVEIELSAYQKWLTDPIQHPVDRLPEAQPTGEAAGVELVSRYRLREIVFLQAWVGVAHSHIELDSGRSIPGDADQRFSTGLVVSWDLEPWVFGLRFKHGTGLPYTSVLGSVYDAGQDAWAPITAQDNGARLPAYTKVDARASRTWSFKRWSLTGSAEVWYVPPAATPLYPIWNYDWSEQSFARGPSLLPLLGLRARF